MVVAAFDSLEQMLYCLLLQIFRQFEERQRQQVGSLRVHARRAFVVALDGVALAVEEIVAECATYAPVEFVVVNGVVGFAERFCHFTH